LSTGILKNASTVVVYTASTTARVEMEKRIVLVRGRENEGKEERKGRGNAPGVSCVVERESGEWRVLNDPSVDRWYGNEEDEGGPGGRRRLKERGAGFDRMDARVEGAGVAGEVECL
jgi:hypothetical protein